MNFAKFLCKPLFEKFENHITSFLFYHIATMACNTFEMKTSNLDEMLDILTTKMMLHHLNISCGFRPQHLWTWVDRSQITSQNYLYKSFDMILDSWTKFKCTGHGAIELGIIKNIPTSFPRNMFGLESRMISSNNVFLKMNIDEYLNLVSFITTNLYNISSLQYIKQLQVNEDNLHIISSKQFTLSNNTDIIQNNKIHTMFQDAENQITDIKSNMTILQRKVEEINKLAVNKSELDDFKDLYDKRLIKLVQEFTKEINDIKLNISKTAVNELKYDITDTIEEKVVEVCDYIDEVKEEINETIDNIHRKIQDELLNIDTELTNLKGKTRQPKKIIDDYYTLTHDNLLEEAVSYYNDNDIEINDIVEVIKMMLNSSKYILSDDFKKNKIDLKDIQFKFKQLATPESISRDDVLFEVFNIDNMVSLI